MLPKPLLKLFNASYLKKSFTKKKHLTGPTHLNSICGLFKRETKYSVTDNILYGTFLHSWIELKENGFCMTGG